MDGWISMERWPECRTMDKPGIVFEVRNAEGAAMFVPCVVPFPGAPWDWTSPPLRFRIVPIEKPRRSGPIPRPATPK